MRALLVSGGFALCLLLVAASSSDKSESGRDSKNGVQQRRRFGGNPRKGLSNTPDITDIFTPPLQKRDRREAPAETDRPSKRRKCPGCYSPLGKQRRAEQDAAALQKGQLRSARQTEAKGGKRRPKYLPAGALTPIRRFRSAQEVSPTQPSRRRKKCPGCFSILGLDDELSVQRRSQRVSRQTKESGGKKRKSKAVNENKRKSSTPIGQSLHPADEPAEHEKLDRKSSKTKDKKGKRDKKDKGRKKNGEEPIISSGVYSALGARPLQDELAALEEKPGRSGKKGGKKGKRGNKNPERNPGALSVLARALNPQDQPENSKVIPSPGHLPLGSAEHREESEGAARHRRHGRHGRHGRGHRGGDRRRGRKREDGESTPEHPEESEGERGHQRHRGGDRRRDKKRDDESTPEVMEPERRKRGGKRHRQESRWGERRRPGGGTSPLNPNL